MNILPWILILVSVSIASGQPVVYPLHTGDRWVFGPSFPFVSAPEAVTGDTLMSNGMRYAVIRYPTRVDFQRQAGSQVFQFDPDSQTEYLWCDFSLSPGDTVNIIRHDNDTLVITLELYRTAVMFGVTRRQWVFLFDVRPFIDDERMVEMTDSLGITSIFMNHGSVYLRGAVINGVAYGDPSGVGDALSGMTGDFRLMQNYPNPFNPVTSIKYQISNPTFRITAANAVTLNVFDVLGREVATLVNELKAPGEYEVRWDASGMAGGIYFYRLQVGGFAAVKKMVVLK